MLMIVAPLLEPDNRFRKRCLLLVTTLVAVLLYSGTYKGGWPKLAYLPPEALVHLAGFGGLAALIWVVLGGRSPAGTVAVVGAIALLDEAMRQFIPGRSPALYGVVADIAGAALVVLALSALRVANTRQVAQARKQADEGKAEAASK